MFLMKVIRVATPDATKTSFHLFVVVASKLPLAAAELLLATTELLLAAVA